MQSNGTSNNSRLKAGLQGRTSPMMKQGVAHGGNHRRMTEAGGCNDQRTKVRRGLTLPADKPKGTDQSIPTRGTLYKCESETYAKGTGDDQTHALQHSVSKDGASLEVSQNDKAENGARKIRAVSSPGNQKYGLEVNDDHRAQCQKRNSPSMYKQPLAKTSSVQRPKTNIASRIREQLHKDNASESGPNALLKNNIAASKRKDTSYTSSQPQAKVSSIKVPRQTRASRIREQFIKDDSSERRSTMQNKVTNCAIRNISGTRDRKPSMSNQYIRVDTRQQRPVAVCRDDQKDQSRLRLNLRIPRLIPTGNNKTKLKSECNGEQGAVDRSIRRSGIKQCLSQDMCIGNIEVGGKTIVKARVKDELAVGIGHDAQPNQGERFRYSLPSNRKLSMHGHVVSKSKIEKANDINPPECTGVLSNNEISSDVLSDQNNLMNDEMATVENELCTDGVGDDKDYDILRSASIDTISLDGQIIIKTDGSSNTVLPDQDCLKPEDLDDREIGTVNGEIGDEVLHSNRQQTEMEDNGSIDISNSVKRDMRESKTGVKIASDVPNSFTEIHTKDDDASNTETPYTKDDKTSLHSHKGEKESVRDIIARAKRVLIRTDFAEDSKLCVLNPSVGADNKLENKRSANVNSVDIQSASTKDSRVWKGDPKVFLNKGTDAGLLGESHNKEDVIKHYTKKKAGWCPETPVIMAEGEDEDIPVFPDEGTQDSDSSSFTDVTPNKGILRNGSECDATIQTLIGNIGRLYTVNEKVRKHPESKKVCRMKIKTKIQRHREKRLSRKMVNAWYRSPWRRQLEVAMLESISQMSSKETSESPYVLLATLATLFAASALACYRCLRP